MHLLVLSAFRLGASVWWRDIRVSQCTFWCSVLSDSNPEAKGTLRVIGLNAPSGAQCFPTECKTLEDVIKLTSQCTFWCSVLSDSLSEEMWEFFASGLNAPSGAQCFPTPPAPRRVGRLHSGLNAPSGAQCFPTRVLAEDCLAGQFGLNAPSGAQCFPTPPPENRATTPFTGTKSPPTWKAPHRIGSHLSN